MGIADLLFIHKTPQDIEELEEIVAREVKGDNFRINNEIAFHGKLYEMTGNETMKRFQTLLLPVFGYVMKLENKKYVSGKITHKDLVKILKKAPFRRLRTDGIPPAATPGPVAPIKIMC